MSAGKGVVAPELDMVLMCKQMHWDYYTYMQQPAWFLELIRVTNNVEAFYQNKLSKEMERKAQATSRRR